MGFTRSRSGRSESAGENPHLGCEPIIDGWGLSRRLAEIFRVFRLPFATTLI